MKATHRNAAHANRDMMALPKFWRPKLNESKKLNCKVIHWDLISRFTDGTADSEVLWDWIETGFTYAQMMTLLHEDGIEFTEEAWVTLADQIAIYPAVIERFRTTGRVGFNGVQLNIARAAGYVMDDLILMDRHGIAVKAGLWAVEQMTKIRREAFQ